MGKEDVKEILSHEDEIKKPIVICGYKCMREPCGKESRELNHFREAYSQIPISWSVEAMKHGSLY